MTAYIDPRGKLFVHMDRLAQLQTGLHPPPVNVEIDPSNRCNLGCTDCHFSHLHTKGHYANTLPVGYVGTGDLMDTGLLLSLPLSLKRFGVRSITWTGGGEPTLHPILYQAMQQAHETGLDQGLYTNAITIDEDMAFIIKTTCQWVYVSLDYPDRETYKTGKSVDLFELACQGTRNLVTAMGNAVVGIGFLLGSQDWRRAGDMLKLGQELSASYIQFRPRILVDPSEPGRVLEDTSWIGECIEALHSLMKTTGVILDLERFHMYGNWNKHPYFTCWWSALQTVITPDGRVWICVNRRGRPDALLGDLNNDSLATIWTRHSRGTVGAGCRVMCRGHIPNLELNEIMRTRPHGNFI